MSRWWCSWVSKWYPQSDILSSMSAVHEVTPLPSGYSPSHGELHPCSLFSAICWTWDWRWTAMNSRRSRYSILIFCTTQGMSSTSKLGNSCDTSYLACISFISWSFPTIAHLMHSVPLELFLTCSPRLWVPHGRVRVAFCVCNTEQPTTLIYLESIHATT